MPGTQKKGGQLVADLPMFATLRSGKPRTRRNEFAILCGQTSVFRLPLAINLAMRSASLVDAAPKAVWKLDKDA